MADKTNNLSYMETIPSIYGESVAGKPNLLIENRLRFNGDIHAHRLFLAMLWRAYEGIDISEPFDVDCTMVMNGLSDGSAYAALKRACKNIIGETVDLLSGQNTGGFKIRSVVVSADYEPQKKSGKLQVRFSPDIVPYIQNMFKEGHYTKIFLKHAMPMRSVYSVRLYELLLQYKKIGTRIIPLEDLRRMLDIPEGKFKIWGDIQNRILKPAQGHLVEYTDISFEFSPCKVGRKVAAVSFVISDNMPTQDFDVAQTELFDVLPVSGQAGPMELPRHIRLIRDNLWPQSQEEALLKFSPERIIYYYEYCKKLDANGGVKNFKGLFYKALFDDPDNFESLLTVKTDAAHKAKRVRDRQLQHDEAQDRLFAEQEAAFDQLSTANQQLYIDRTPPFGGVSVRKPLAVKLYFEEMEIAI